MRHYGNDYASSAISFTETIANLIWQRWTKTRNFLGISTGIMRLVERIMHPGIRDRKGMITRCCSSLPGVAESLRTGFTKQLVKQPMKFEFLPATLRPSLQVLGMQTLELIYHRPRVDTGILYNPSPCLSAIEAYLLKSYLSPYL